MTAIPLASDASGDPLAHQRLLRRPEELMRPARLAALQPSRISASRSVMVDAIRDRWAITCRRFDIDERGRGTALYRIDIGGWRFSFPVYSFEPSSAGRTGRIIGRAWDMMGALVEGDISAADFDTTAVELPKLYEGRATPGTLIWARSNRSARFFTHALEALASGRQPDVGELARTCYLMRNTGLDGNGTFGTRSFLVLEKQHPFRRSLAAQMASAYMMRVFAQDLVQHLARKASGRAVPMAPELARFLGVGNGSALGLMFFMNNHPRLIDRWIGIREECIARAKALEPSPDQRELAELRRLLGRAITFRREDRVVYETITPSDRVAADLAVIADALDALIAARRAGQVRPMPLAELAASLDGRVSNEAIETLYALMIELVADTADRLCGTLVLDEELVGRPEMSVTRLRELIAAHYGWAFRLDLTSEAASRYVWYKSVNAEEPRRGPRSEAGDVVDLGYDLARAVVALDRDLAEAGTNASLARFLLAHPRHRLTATRIQALVDSAYHSVMANILAEDFVPADITRLLNVGLHGIDKTRDFLNRNLRGVLFHGAPTVDDLASGAADPTWFYPAEPSL
jgi:hypothetical protein